MHTLATITIIAQAAVEELPPKPPITAELLWKILYGGGWMMIPLFILATYLFVTGFRLLLYVWGEKLGHQNTPIWRKWIQDPASATGPIANIIQYTQANVRDSKDVHNRFNEVRESVLGVVNRNLVMLDTLVGAAPLMGLLGTVVGMLATFDGLAQSAGPKTQEIVAAGIKAALLTTMTGLTIALPGLFLAMVIRSKKRSIEAGLAELQSLTLSHLKLD